MQAKSDYNFENYKEENMALKRQEAKEICKQFRRTVSHGPLVTFVFFNEAGFFIVEKAF